MLFRSAGVEQIIMCTPPDKEGKVYPTTLVAAKEAGVDVIYKAAVSMDYSIFLLHSFSRFRASGMDVQDAMSHAVKDSFSSATSSALTTVIGFAALIDVYKRQALASAAGRRVRPGSFTRLSARLQQKGRPLLLLIASGLVPKTNITFFI